MTLTTTISVFLGGGAGAVVRYFLSRNNTYESWPYGTLAANTLACVLLGYLLARYPLDSPNTTLKALLAVGFCGGLSTFSTWAYELYHYSQHNQMAKGVVYIVISLALGITGLYVGNLISRL